MADRTDYGWCENRTAHGGYEHTQQLLLVAEGAKDGVILVAGDVEVMKALPA